MRAGANSARDARRLVRGIALAFAGVVLLAPVSLIGGGWSLAVVPALLLALRLRRLR